MSSLTTIGKDFQDVFKELGKVVVGQQEVMKQMLVAIMCNGNALLESVPGLAKTLTIKTLAEIMELKFSRIQNTPDLMPSDITGTYIIEEEDGKRKFKFQPGPIFANIVLADEINRATPKTQGALLEAMQEKQVTVGNKTFALDRPFFVLATQNPVEQEGTYPLPEAQTDRFLFKIITKYPEMDEEEEILERFTSYKEIPQLNKVLSKNTLSTLQVYVRHIHISKDLSRRIVRIVDATRKGKSLLEYGASPRATIGLAMASKARAMMKGRKYVTSADIDAIAHP